ncbi:hypothetical protein C5S25_05870 [Clostridium perfringens]
MSILSRFFNFDLLRFYRNLLEYSFFYIAIILGMVTIVYIFYDIIFSGIYLRARGETYGL